MTANTNADVAAMVDDLHQLSPGRFAMGVRSPMWMRLCRQHAHRFAEAAALIQSQQAELEHWKQRAFELECKHGDLQGVFVATAEVEAVRETALARWRAAQSYLNFLQRQMRK